MPAPKEVQELVEKFARNREAYTSPRFNETQLRIEFLNPLFTALGWDMDNKKGRSEAYREVVHEDKIKVGDATKAPDYSFRAGGQRKFFLEAKKPSVNIESDPGPAFQLRRYAWNANKLPISILSDFEEFAVYDNRFKPKESDKASTARVLFYKYTDYLEKWDEIAGLFSQDAVLNGNFDKFAEGGKGRKGIVTVDQDFLQQIEGWRELMAKNLAIRNDSLTVETLNFAVQKIIDRIVFLRICEGRGIETVGRLLGATNGSDVYDRLCRLFGEADEKYNSGLFHFRTEKDQKESPDTLTQSLFIDDKVLKEIISDLYPPKSPYEFGVLPVEILGQVYEQFLGKVIRLTAGHQAKVEEKPEVRKAGGVYYTPQYIVDYIVKNTVGKLLEGKTPKTAAALKILDPACGSGSFLLGAYRFLIDWHRDWYENNNPENYAKGKSPAIFLGPGGQWRLTSIEKKRILLNNIHGVDIDAQAVEVTKLSLLLQVLEGESEQTLRSQLTLFKERALPDLGGNIKCGNSLIGWDFFDGQLSPDPELVKKINPFDWEREFPSVFLTTKDTKDTKKKEKGGFDAVIGNPPYVRIQGYPEDQISYFSAKYNSAKKNYDLYVNFIEAGFNLLSCDGLLGEILPNKFFKTDYGLGLRKTIATNSAIYRIIDFNENQVFNATTYTCLLFLTRTAPSSFEYAQSEASQKSLSELDFRFIKSATITENAWEFADDSTKAIAEKLISNSTKLLDLPAQMSRGSSSGNDDVFMPDHVNSEIEPKLFRTPVFSSDFSRYKFHIANKWKIIFPYELSENKYSLIEETDLRKSYPKAYGYLKKNFELLKERKQFKSWYSYSAPRNLELHDHAQIIIPLLADRGSFALLPESESGNLCPMASGGFTLTIDASSPYSVKYILGLLNSKLLFWKLRTISNVFRDGWITCTKQYFGELPIRKINFDNTAEKLQHDRLVGQVDQMLNLFHRLDSASSPADQERLQRQIAVTDRQIDTLVYELYGLTDEEIKIVEGAS